MSPAARRIGPAPPFRRAFPSIDPSLSHSFKTSSPTDTSLAPLPLLPQALCMQSAPAQHGTAPNQLHDPATPFQCRGVWYIRRVLCALQSCPAVHYIFQRKIAWKIRDDRVEQETYRARQRTSRPSHQNRMIRSVCPLWPLREGRMRKNTFGGVF